MATYIVDGYVGREPAISAYKAAMEAAIQEAGVGSWMKPIVGQPPENLAVGTELPGFICAVPDDFIAPPLPELGVYRMQPAVAQALQAAITEG